MHFPRLSLLERSRAPLLLVCLAGMQPGLLGISQCSSDGDGDGWTASEGDCDDSDADTYPGALELCDGRDNNCDGAGDSGSSPIRLYPDQDGDGWGGGAGAFVPCDEVAGTVSRGLDCLDTDAGVHPGAQDAAGDGQDQDCGGTTGQDPTVGFGVAPFASIQAAIDAAADGATVYIGPGTWLEHVGLANRLLTLRGVEGSAETLLDGGGSGTVLNVGGGTLVLSGLTIQHGGASGVGMAKAVVTLEDVVVTENTSSWYGGGLYVSESTLTMNHCRVTDNEGWELGGGFVGLNSIFYLTDTRIDHNRVDGNGAAMDLHYGRVVGTRLWVEDNMATGGGGAFSGYFATFQLFNSVVKSNSSGAFGGAVMVNGGTIESRNSTFDSNTAITGGALYVLSANAIVENSVLVNNVAGEGGGILFKNDDGTSKVPSVRNSVVAYNSGYNIFQNSTYPYPGLTLEYNVFYVPAGLLNTNLGSISSTNLKVEPQFLSYDANACPADLHLAKGSPLANAGDPALQDADGSRADVGAYGGARGIGWDRDGDLSPDWYWPGTITDAPAGIDPAGFDCNDLDPSVPRTTGCPD